MEEALSTGWIGGVSLVEVKDVLVLGGRVVLSSALVVSGKGVSVCWYFVGVESLSGGMIWIV